MPGLYLSSLGLALRILLNALLFSCNTHQALLDQGSDIRLNPKTVEMNDFSFVAADANTTDVACPIEAPSTHPPGTP